MVSERWAYCRTQSHHQGGRKLKICPGLSCPYFSDRYFDSLNRKYLPYCEKHKTFLDVDWENQIVFLAEKCTFNESDYQNHIKEYDCICKEIRRRILGGVQVSEGLIKFRERLERLLQTTHIRGEPCWRQQHQLPRDINDISGVDPDRLRYD